MDQKPALLSLKPSVPKKIPDRTRQCFSGLKLKMN